MEDNLSAWRDFAFNADEYVSPHRFCVFRANLDTDSAANWTVIPAQTGHVFHGKPDT